MGSFDNMILVEVKDKIFETNEGLVEYIYKLLDSNKADKIMYGVQLLHGHLIELLNLNFYIPLPFYNIKFGIKLFITLKNNGFLITSYILEIFINLLYKCPMNVNLSLFTTNQMKKYLFSIFDCFIQFFSSGNFFAQLIKY